MATCYACNTRLAPLTPSLPASGHWYEGGGLYRPVHLVRADPVHIVHDGLYVSSETTNGVVPVSAEVENLSNDDVEVAVQFQLMSLSGTVLATFNATAASVSKQAINMFDAQLDVSKLSIWSIQTPSLYRVQAQVFVKGQLVDEDSTLAGFRTMTWSGQTGFALNNKSFDFRGFSNHHSLTGG